jgi:hypothetical protein
MDSLSTEILRNWSHLFRMYKSLGEKAIAQVPDERLFWTFYNDSNSIGMIVQHLSGNMVSRFTNFFEEDGEKAWRNRDREFESVLSTRKEIISEWETGWACLFSVLDSLTEKDFTRSVLIRNEPHTLTEAIQRQLAHYSYHTGQIVFLAKMLAAEGWKSLSIPKGGSDEFNKRNLGN